MSSAMIYEYISIYEHAHIFTSFLCDPFCLAYLSIALPRPTFPDFLVVCFLGCGVPFSMVKRYQMWALIWEWGEKSTEVT